MEYLIPILIILLLILLNGLFVAAEFSIVGAPQTRIAQLAEEGSQLARRVLTKLRDLNRQNRYIATAQVGITLASLGLGMYGEHIVSEWFVGPLERLPGIETALAHTFAIALAILLLTYLHVVLGEMVPKSIALLSAETSVLRLEKPMTWMEYLFFPIVFILNAIGNGILRFLRVPPASSGSRLMSPEELEYIVEESFGGGLIEANEHLFIENILDLSERTVGQIMTPRTRIAGIPVTITEGEVLHLVCDARFTRFPVFDGNLDQIVGIMHTKNLARQQVHIGEEFDIHRISRPAVFVPESLSLEEMLVRFRQEGDQMAIVMDEFGGTAGLVTMEDLVEEVVGEILDEFDQEIPPIQKLGKNRLRVRGDLLLAELNQHYDLILEHPDADTVGGLIMAVLGRVVRPMDTIETDGMKFEVETVEGHAARTVVVTFPSVDESSNQIDEINGLFDNS
jgi:CBS domain containing-hemolysin-like protein